MICGYSNKQALTAFTMAASLTVIIVLTWYVSKSSSFTDAPTKSPTPMPTAA